MTKLMQIIRTGAFAVFVTALVGLGSMTMNAGLALVTDHSAQAQQNGDVPGNTLGNISDAQMWRAIKGGVSGTVSIPDKKAAQMVQADGDAWRAFKNGPLSIYGAWSLLAILILLVVFFAVRGRIKIDHGFDPQGRTIERFNALERAVHWLTATSFIVLAFTGLNILYGRYFLKPVIGPEAFGTLTYYGKLAHNYIAFAFMVGIALMFVLWVRYNIPKGRDLKWLAIGGGLFSKGVHPEAGRFNAGQKIIFWAVVLGGFSLSLSGVAMMWPFEIQPWAGTFAFINNFGADLPTSFTPLQEAQISVLWHSVVALIMIVIVIAHIYIGSVGMEGAFDAVGTGQVDLNWAKEHHSLWVEEEMHKGSGQQQPAE
ncbi:formate dehydrogenase subunit gamma [Thalassospiraceae bacterium LMO-JJ14]|nr:formate dehydrogenase subunit gamma [Thalassospiraceae bacterium LMO-JJ14]